MEMVWELIAAFWGTFFFALVFSSPRRFLFLSGLNGFIAWLVYLISFKFTRSIVASNFAATSAVVIFSQVISLKKRVPLDVFLVPGIFVLVPGSTIYKMLFSFVFHDDSGMFSSLKETLSIGFSIAMAIFIFVYVFEFFNKIRLSKIISRSDQPTGNLDEIFSVALLIGELMLENGAETHKVEESMNTFFKFNGLSRSQSFVTPTGIFVTLLEKRNQPITEIIRISKRSLNLSHITQVMEELNEYYDRKINLDELVARLRQVPYKCAYANHELYIGAAFGVAFFSVIFKGGLYEFVNSALVGLFAQVIILKLSRFQFPDQLINLVISVFIAFLAALLIKIPVFAAANINIIIISAVMLLVPGVTIINSLREIIAGDLVSGSARGFEALIIAASIASGVGAALKIMF